MPMEKVHISETSTDKVPNTSPTAASVSTDLYGMAVKSCCDQIMERLRPYREADPSAGWEEWVSCSSYLLVYQVEMLILWCFADFKFSQLSCLGS